MRELKEKLKRISNKEARKYLLDSGFYPEEFVLPPFFKSQLSKLKLKSINWNDKRIDKKFPIEENPITLRVHKNNNCGWRKFGFIHPWHYSQIINEITNKKSWKFLIDFFCKDRGVVSYSLPVLNGNRVENGITFWRKMEDDILENSTGLDFLVHADIKNFYQSIYTHSISWALHRKSYIRNGRWKDKSILGNRLDKLFQNSNDRQTNGIFVGPLISEIIAEIILLAIDKNVYNKIKKNKIECKAYRYRDDYRILCRSVSDCKKVLYLITEQLEQYNLELNDDKTKFFDIVSDGTIRPWVKEIMKIIASLNIVEKKGNKKIRNLKIIIALLIDLQKKYPKNNILMTFIGRLEHGEKGFDDFILNESFNKKEAKQLINQLMSFTSINIGIFRDAIRIISKILSYHFRIKKEKAIFLSNILGGAINHDSIYEFIWAIYLFRYFNIQKKLTKKLLNEERKFCDNLAYRLLRPLILNKIGKGAIFDDKEDFNSLENYSLLLDTNFSSQQKRKVVENSLIFSYSGN